ncbi:cell wall-binding repeat-containing protein [Herbiconiux sp.]|uniref:cell wall-binding repeat-containing protein n=1 Tax=Herbiconiux sp. TaxID=1871186 RepID=UPI0025C65E34|nr:cell wall-binding repeat-containing protein [Herbiconiux sp.]
MRNRISTLAVTMLVIAGVLGTAGAVSAETIEPPVPAEAPAAETPSTAEPTPEQIDPEVEPEVVAPDPATTELPRFTAPAPADFAARAAELPADLGEAVARDLEATPEEYLARTDAALQAGVVVEALSSRVDVLGSRLDGTQLVVNVADDEAAALVESTGATAELGAPTVPDYSGVRLEAMADLLGGQAFQFLAAGATHVCSTGFVGRYGPYPQVQFITSGHCIEPDRQSGTYYYESKQARAGSAPSRGSIIGAPIESLFRFGGGSDVGVVGVSDEWTPTKKVGTWGGSQGALTDGNPVTVTDMATGVVGSPVCKSGRTTGWTCGTILVMNESYPVYNRSGTPQYVNLTLTDVCMLPGDSGSSALIGSAAFGLGTAGTFTDSCSNQPDAITAFFPMITSNGTKSVSNTVPDWELSVAVNTPTVVRPSFVGDTIRGTLPGAGPRHRVLVTIDSNAYYVTPNASGDWSLPIPAALQTGRHTFTVAGRWGSFSSSSVISDSYQLRARPAVERVDGVNRYTVALTISQRAYPAGSTAPTVYLATGANYPDALSAVPAAVKGNAPLLLTPTERLLPEVAAEIRRLKPATIVVVGGPVSVSDAVVAELRPLAATVDRISGSDRYEASRAVARYAFGTAARSYVATGTNFPDALSAGSAAGSAGVPITLVYGPTATADAATISHFRTLQTSRITIAGGPNSVSPGVGTALRDQIPAAVERLSGTDRFTASLAINRAAYSASSVVYLATGFNYPDALAGGVLAAKGKAPLYMVPTDCVPRGVIDDIATLKATKVVLLGGPNSLNASVGSLSACSF